MLKIVISENSAASNFTKASRLDRLVRFSSNEEMTEKYRCPNLLVASLVKLGGLFVTCSCSSLVLLWMFEECVSKGVHRLNRRMQFFDRTGPGIDHPIYSNFPESRHLKVP